MRNKRTNVGTFKPFFPALICTLRNRGGYTHITIHYWNLIGFVLIWYNDVYILTQHVETVQLLHNNTLFNFD